MPNEGEIHAGTALHTTAVRCHGLSGDESGAGELTEIAGYCSTAGISAYHTEGRLKRGMSGGVPGEVGFLRRGKKGKCQGWSNVSQRMTGLNTGSHFCHNDLA